MAHLGIVQLNTNIMTRIREHKSLIMEQMEKQLIIKMVGIVKSIISKQVQNLNVSFTVNLGRKSLLH